MKTVTKITVVLFFIVLSFVGGFLYSNMHSWTSIHEKEDSTVVLEKIKKVAKMITVEGEFSELYSYKDYYGYDISPLRKKAIVRVNAKASVGYDFNKMQINIYPDKGRVVIKNFPNAELLSIEHDIDYYDITEGVFNGFEVGDYNKMLKASKDKIVNAALTSNLFEKAEEQKAELIQLLGFMVEQMGYELIIEERLAIDERKDYLE